MRQSTLFTKTTKDISSEEKSVNASLLIRAGFIDKVGAGIYTYLPLGIKVLRNIENIIRTELNKTGAQEILMPALTPKDGWIKTDRWDHLDVLFKTTGHDKKEYALGATHEEIVTPLAQKYTFSYKDLPMHIYQIQTKFRNEPRAKSGILRGREFGMKDLYSFHADEKDFDAYYEQMKTVYMSIFEKCGLGDITHLTFASGGSFSKYSHEFQTVAENGEDTIYVCSKCKLAYNKEIINEISDCQGCSATKNDFKEQSAIEVGNIFDLKIKFSKAFGYTFNDAKDKEQPVLMGCYGIGSSRVMGTVVEIFNDKNGIIWPKSIAPFAVHLISLGINDTVKKQADKTYEELTSQGIEVLYDDRDESAGVKFTDSDLIGIPLRVVISDKTLDKNQAELKYRNQDNATFEKLDSLVKIISKDI